MNRAIVATALAIRQACPWIGMSDALTYADPSTVQGRSFRSKSGFFGSGFSRTDIAFAWAWYAMLWAPVNRRQVARLGPCARLETEDEEVKRAYGSIVRHREGVFVAWERFARRCKKAGRPCPPWPGTRNMLPRGSESRTVRGWLESHGLEHAIDLYASNSSPYAFTFLEV